MQCISFCTLSPLVHVNWQACDELRAGLPCYQSEAQGKHEMLEFEPGVLTEAVMLKPPLSSCCCAVPLLLSTCPPFKDYDPLGLYSCTVATEIAE